MTPSLAAVMVVIIASAFALVIGSLVLRYKRRELEHKERLAALEKGAAPVLAQVERRAPWSPRLYLLRGLIWLFSGIALTLCLVSVATTSMRPLTLEERARRATWLKQSGATDEQVREVWHDTSTQGGPPLGLAFIGLIPIGVGAAYLIFYRVEGRNLPNFTSDPTR